MKKYITVLDFEVGRVFQYKINKFVSERKNLRYKGERGYDSDYYEKFIVDKSHRLGNCQWMIHENGDIINKTGDLPF
jgi:hypothetical protein